MKKRYLLLTIICVSLLLSGCTTKSDKTNKENYSVAIIKTPKVSEINKKTSIEYCDNDLQKVVIMEKNRSVFVCKCFPVCCYLLLFQKFLQFFTIFFTYIFFTIYFQKIIICSCIFYIIINPPVMRIDTFITVFR